jgi:hypothetical protein
MEYPINHETIMAVVEEEVSRVAARSYSSDGVALYDAIRISSRDKDTLGRLMADMAGVIKSRFRLFVTVMPDGSLSFRLPDLPEHLQGSIAEELDRFISMGVVAKWLEEKKNDQAGVYMERATASINEAELLMMTRKPIAREDSI